MNHHRPLLTLDFDGVLHSYHSGWQGAGNIPDPPVGGAIAFLHVALKHFRVAICSSRCVDETVAFVFGVKCVSSEINVDGVRGIMEWLDRHGLPREDIESLEFWACKPPSHVMIDDRAIQFVGNFGSIEDLVNFRPWNHHIRHG